MQFQDWEPVVFTKKQKSSNNNKQNAAGTKEFNKLLNDEIPATVNYSVDHSSQLILLRNKKGISQSELAGKLLGSGTVKDIQGIENRTGKYNKVFFNRLIRILEKLPDKINPN
jgi:ribosome-binding protein aMBF1 (putative translation factor)